ncbi:MAG: hypothetical protein FJX25_09035 [Alphaproteobacteria bacterium]|nr:hypothetical protein [Alphaproteobacteria bacterium]
MRKSVLELIPQTVDRLVEHYQFLDALNPIDAETGNLLEELEDLKVKFIEHEFSIFKPPSGGRAIEEEGTEHAYSRRITELIDSAAANPAAALALDIHAANCVLYNLPMPFSLRGYIADRLVGDVPSSKPANRPKVFPLRDALIVDVIEGLVQRHGLSAYGSAADGFAGSACWVVAEAQRQLGRTPNSPRTVAKMLMIARRAEKAEAQAAAMASTAAGGAD